MGRADGEEGKEGRPEKINEFYCSLLMGFVSILESP